MRPGRVPLHRSLLGRLLATSVLIAVAAIVATAWLAVQSTSRAIRQEQGRSLADDKSIYDTLIGYAATHQDWTGVRKTVDAEAARLGRRITLMTDERQVIADSHPGTPLATTRASATVDPLRLDPGLTDTADRIDPRVLGPYRLTAQEHRKLTRQAQIQLDCMRQSGGVDGKVMDDPSGRPVVRTTTGDPQFTAGLCRLKWPIGPAGSEQQALEELEWNTEECLGVRHGVLMLDRTFAVVALKVRPVDPNKLTSCVTQSRLRQLRPYTTQPALLYVTDPNAGTADEPVFSLSRENLLRIAWVTGAVLLATVLLTVLTGRRLVRPLRALTEAAMAPAGEPAPMPVRGKDEIGFLARALNDATERREQAETQRRLMVSDVAHELRNPLTNIRAWLEAAQDEVVPANPALLDLLHDEAIMLHHIIDDLSDLAAADAGDLRLHREPIFVRDVLTHVCESQRGAAEKAQVTLTADLRGDPVADADPVRLRQTVGNLLSNAIRYTPAGGTVTLSAAASSDELTIAVQDTGIGIAREDLPRIFDRFWRADSSRTRATGGSGLGLPIARKLAEAHGGTLSAASRPGAGTTMTLRLPLSS
ncbi:sensor histidine kinase [Actinoplanes sp. NPDC049265]|uniref:sensor histidine kinase n=1 Tax=Actinoplanes sp. NPDC049265 TaxID=3363902 RepID=UPI0037204018